EIEPVILSAAAAHGELVERAQSGHGFASIKDAHPSAGYRVDKLAGERGDPAQTLHHVEDDALARQDDPRVMADDGDRLCFVKTDTVEDVGMSRNFVMGSHGAVESRVDIENARNGADAGENTILLRQDSGGGALVGLDAGIAGRVVGGAVFLQRIFDYGGDA